MAAFARYPAACLALGRTVGPLPPLLDWVSELQRVAPRAIPYARLSVCWKAADLWHEESGRDDLSQAVYSLQEELYLPSSAHRMDLLREIGALGHMHTYRRHKLRARRGKAMLRVVRATAASLLNGKSSNLGGPAFGYLFPEQWTFSAFLSTCLWLFEAEDLVALIADAIGECVLHEEGDSSVLELASE